MHKISNKFKLENAFGSILMRTEPILARVQVVTGLCATHSKNTNKYLVGYSRLQRYVDDGVQTFLLCRGSKDFFALKDVKTMLGQEWHVHSYITGKSYIFFMTAFLKIVLNCFYVDVNFSV